VNKGTKDNEGKQHVKLTNKQASKQTNESYFLCGARHGVSSMLCIQQHVPQVIFAGTVVTMGWPLALGVTGLIGEGHIVIPKMCCHPQ